MNKLTFLAAALFAQSVTAIAAAVAESPPLRYDIYVRGAFNGWGTDNVLAWQGKGVYQADVHVSPGPGSGADSEGTTQPAFPSEQPRPGSPLSTTVTSWPRRTSSYAQASPIAPAPTTTVFGMSVSFLRSARALQSGPDGPVVPQSLPVN